MKLYNSLTRQIEPFNPRGEEVSVYVCGITPYDTTHLGHAFTYTAVDVLIRYLEYRGYRVRYVQNVTDIDDDILRKANEVKEDWRTLGDRWTAHFIEDMIALNVRAPDLYPRATDVIEEIIDLVRRLLDAGVAYTSGGSVYFSVESWGEFGKLSQLSSEQMLPIANERGNNPDDPHKRHPLDFVLWQTQAPGEPAWESPWGRGRPGWHIECSTMSTHYLGEPIDLHGGGADLIFPHHECEIAQVEPLTDPRPFVRHWMHTAMVRYGGKKMSKSLGNLVMVRDLLKSHSPDAVRLYLAAQHYRQIWDYDETALNTCKALAAKLCQAAATPVGDRVDPDPFVAEFKEALDQDLNTPRAIEGISRLGDAILGAHRKEGDAERADQALSEMGFVFGLRLNATQPETRVTEGWKRHLARFSTLGGDRLLD